MPGTPTETTVLLAAMAAGDRDAGEKLFSIVYEELHDRAHVAMVRERPGHLLQTTALVHEAYLRLLPGGGLEYKDRAHFFRVAGRAIRRILIDEANKRNAAKRGGGRHPHSLDELRELEPQNANTDNSFEDLEALEIALNKLEKHESLKWMCTIVDLHFFVGLSFDKISEFLSVSKGKVMRDWNFTKAWLRRELER